MSALPANLVSVDQAVAALPTVRSRSWLVNFLCITQFDPSGLPIYRNLGRDKLIYLDRLEAAIASHQSFVYFVAGGNFVKIGFSRSFRQRLHKMATDLPFEIEVLHFETGTRQHEKMLHQRFSALHVRGEWFRRAPELLAFIHARKRAGGPL